MGIVAMPKGAIYSNKERALPLKRLIHVESL